MERPRRKAFGPQMLRYKADRRTVFFIALYFALLAATWNLVEPAWLLDPTRFWVVLLAFGALCVLSFMGAVATHNAVHCPVFRKRWHNKIFQVALTLTYGHPVSAYVPGHNLSHHKHTQTRKDVMRTTKARFRWNLLNLLFFVLLIAPSIVKGEGEYFRVMKKRLPRWYRQYQIELASFWGVQIGLFALDYATTGAVWRALAFWFLPQVYAKWGIVTMNLLQHDGCDEASRYNHSRNFVGKAVNWWTYNNGFHSIHHDIPGLHWSLAPAEHAKVYAGNIHPNLDQKSLLAYVFRAFILNKRERYDGAPLVLAPVGADENWIPDPEATMDDLGAEGAAVA